jgi:murein DD-endopeptidase MepM/ murein hydrolase activator NlpD
VPEPRDVHDTITLMVMQGPTGNIRKIQVSRASIKKGLSSALIVLCVMIGLSVDYVRARVQLSELSDLRVESGEQREQIDEYSAQMGEIAQRLAQIDQLERKLRVITNLDPADPMPLPGIGGTGDEDLGADGGWQPRSRRHKGMLEGLGALSAASSAKNSSLEGLLAHLEENSARLLQTPSIAPTKGWMTSTFGYRTSPFTGNREFHRGIDIAGRAGTPVLATADGVVQHAGARRALGKSVILRHGYGVETKYGHLQEVLVQPGDRVKRGQKIGLMGSTGRSTGPHLHYQLEVNRKPVDPQNYILD